MTTTETVWEFACRLCDLRSLHRDEYEASLAAKAHTCPSGRRTAGMVSRMEAVVINGQGGEKTYAWPTPETNRTEARKRQRRIEKALGD